MADFNSSQPIRTESAGDVQVKIVDSTVTSQQLKVEADGSINANIQATDLDIRDLDAAQDNVAISDGTDTLAINADGSINITDNGASLTVDATDLDIRDLNSAQDSVTVLATDLDIRDLTHVSDSIKIGDGTEFLAVNADGSINVVPQEDPGTERVDFDQASAIAAGASSNHDFVFTNEAKLFQVQASASGKMKAEVQIETGSSTNVFNTVMVGFNSTATPNVDLMFAKYALIPAGARVRVIRTNRDTTAMDLYSTIVAIES